MTRQIAIIIGLLFAAACTSPADNGDLGERRGATKLGKADHISGSCGFGDCGGQSADGCWCDELCVNYGDCCPDAANVCSVDECNDSSDCHDGELCYQGEPYDCIPKGTCGAMDAAGEGACEKLLGYGWNGTECVSLSGCSCTGADCDKLYSGPGSCAAAHEQCLPPDGSEGSMCGGFAGFGCDSDLFCDYGDHCGAGDQSGVCTAVPDNCTTAWAPVCGCDGVTYGNTCNAHQAGVSVVHLGECVTQEPNSCEGHCGGQSEDASCWCDSLCSYYGDCCADKADHC